MGLCIVEKRKRWDFNSLWYSKRKELLNDHTKTRNKSSKSRARKDF
jgi:hypothetical protein